MAVMTSLKRQINDFGGLLMGRTYYRAVVKAKLRFSGSHPPLLVWQMGKVGSRTILESLHDQRYRGAMFHVHVLSDYLTRKGEVSRRASIRGNVAFLYSDVLREEIRRGDREWKVITLVREPVGRNLSAFFQNLDVYLPGVDIGSMDSQVLEERFFATFDHDRPVEWFAHEFPEVLGLDIYASAFPKQQGYQVINTGPVDVLVLRMEDLNRVGEGVLAEFLGMEHVSLTRTNVGSSKGYARQYADVKKHVRIPKDYLDRMYDSEYARHFYTQEELAGFRSRWTA